MNILFHCYLLGLALSGNLCFVFSDEDAIQRIALQVSDSKSPSIINAEVPVITATGFKVTWELENFSSDADVLFRVNWTGVVNWKPEKTVQGTDGTAENYYILTNLIPFSTYEFCINALVDGSSTEQACEENIVTNETVPSTPRDLTAHALNGGSMEVTWSKPLLENGEIIEYNLFWRILGEENVDWSTVTTSEMRYKLENLEGCTFYEIQVDAATSAGNSEAALTSSSTLEEAPPSVEKLNGTVKSPTSVLLTWVPPSTNCTISYYTLTATYISDRNQNINSTVLNVTIYVEEGEYLVKDLTPWSDYSFCLIAHIDEDLVSPKSCVPIKTPEGVPGPPTSLTVEEDCTHMDSMIITWKDPVELNGQLKNFKVIWKSNTERTNFVAHDESTIDYRYKIQDLKPNTNYHISVMASTSVGYGVAAETDATTSLNVVGITLGVTIPIIIILIIVGVCYINREKIRIDSIKKASPANVADEISEVESPSIPLPHLKTYLKNRLLRGDCLRIEFESIQSRSAKKEIIEANKPQNFIKNRYANMLPFDDNRVILKNSLSDYINASYVDSYLGKKLFIATQGPLECTLDAFYCMIWEENVDIIVALTLCVEAGKQKCHPYWPAALSNELKIGDFSIQVVTEEISILFVIRILEITRKGDMRKRLVKQYQYISWPDFGAPSTPDELLKFLLSAKYDYETKKGDRKILVHCDGGVGRTGLFVGLWNLIEQVEQGNNSLSVVKEVLNLRKQRPNLVQNEDQYLCLYKCITSYYEEQSKWRMKPSVEDKSFCFDEIPQDSPCNYEEDFIGNLI